MALTKEKSIDRIETLETLVIQVREATAVFDDESGEKVQISRSFHRYILCPGDDLTGEPDNVTAIANAVWTDEAIAKFAETDLRKITSSRGGDDSDKKLDEDGNPLPERIIGPLGRDGEC